MLPSSSNTLLILSVPVGVGAAVAVPFRLSAVVQWSIFALVKRTDVVASVAMNSRLSTPMPMVHFQKFRFLVTGVPPCVLITQFLWLGDASRLTLPSLWGIPTGG